MGGSVSLNICLLVLAQVTRSQFMSVSPTSGSVLTEWKLLGILSHTCAHTHSLSLSLPLPCLYTVSLSTKKKCVKEPRV